MGSNNVTRRQLLKRGGAAIAAGVTGALLLPELAIAAPRRRSRWDSGVRSGTPTPTPAAGTSTPSATPAPTSTPTSTPAPTSTPQAPAATGLYQAMDTDFGGSGVQPQSWFDAARAAGYEGFATTLHTFWNGQPKPWTQSAIALERALAAGMWVGAYGRPVSHWQQALNSLPRELREQLKFFALDVEVEPSGTFAVKRAYVDGVRDQFGVRPIIYSGWGMWGDVMGSGVTSFSDVPLWDFSGDRSGWPSAMTDPVLRQYGGWNTPSNLRSGWQVQMQSPATFQGVKIDRDVFSRSFIDAV
jgi:hypothetical protein